jgi:hypothetical protein
VLHGERRCGTLLVVVRVLLIHATLSGKLPEIVSAFHAYEVAETLTYVKDGQVLPHYQT